MSRTGFPSIDKLHLQGISEEKLHPTIYPLSLLATFLQINSNHLEEIAIEEQGKHYTKFDIKNGAELVAKLLLVFGLKSGDKIALMMPNCFEGVIITIGANAIGVKVAMLEPSIADHENLLAEEMTAHQPKLLFTYGHDADWVEKVLQAYKSLDFCVVVNSPDAYTEENYGLRSTFKACEGKISEEIVRQEINAHNLSEIDEPMIYLKTSGSTSGKPKTLPFSNRAIFASLIYASNSTGTKTRDASVNRVLCNAPYQHGYGWMPLFINLLGGNQVVMAGASEDDIANYYLLRPSYIYGTPLALKQFMRLTPEDADLSFLTAFFCAGATIPEEEYEAGINYFRAHNSKAEIRNNYGISEGLCIGTASDGVPHLPGTIGKFYVGPEWLIVDENLNEVKYGETGEVIVSAESLCQGYFNDEAATKDAFIKRDGKTFFRTGDYLSLSEDGYVRFAGRKRRFFFAEGVTDKVNCETIEQALDNLKEVEVAAVVIKKDARGVEGAKAFVVRSGNIDEKTLRNLLASSLQSYQIPREIVFVGQLPYMESGKINYKLLETE